jgi:hypothetical protein
MNLEMSAVSPMLKTKDLAETNVLYNQAWLFCRESNLR